MSVTLKVQQGGKIKFPADLLEKYGIYHGDTFRLVDLDGIFVLAPLVSLVPELAREMERARLEAGLSSEELLSALNEQRERYYTEKYGSGPSL